MSLQPVGSIFNLSADQVEFYTKQRLGLNENYEQSAWGCSSNTGFLDVGESLLECGQKDRETLEARKVTYQKIADLLKTLFSLARKEKPGTVIEGKFTVRVSRPTLFGQYCPFSPLSYDSVNSIGACGKSCLDFTVFNESNYRSVEVSGLLVHLIEDHHFFEGNVPHRVGPIDFIKTLEIEPEADFTSAIPFEIQPKLSPVWCAVCSEPFKSMDRPVNLAIKYDKKLYDFRQEVVGVVLPYSHFDDEYPDMAVFFPGLNYLHLFNRGTSKKTVSGTADGVRFEKIEVPPERRLILELSTHGGFYCH